MSNRSFYSALCSLVLMLTLAQSQASLMTDTDGFSVSLTTSGDDTNFFGPPDFTDNYNPFGAFGNTLPAPFGDGTEIEVSFFDTYFEIRQFARSSFEPIAADWTMLFSSIENATPIVMVSFDEISNTFPHELVLDSTGDSISVLFAGGSTDTLAIGAEAWFARVNLEFDLAEVPVPPTLFIALLASFYLFYRAKQTPLAKDKQ
ncbi:hypothetical protein PN836_014110 [Ningiella sp. W23]|uniref:hypothetical protein n=1 Tax=Ningiella sp. W23 TaxID=3023715 RepID=UPI00375744AE